MRLKGDIDREDRIVKFDRRIDVRPGEMLEYDTGIEYLRGKGESVGFNPYNATVDRFISSGKRGYNPVILMLRNYTDKTYMFYPGDVLGKLVVFQRATLKSRVTLIGSNNGATRKRTDDTET